MRDNYLHIIDNIQSADAEVISKSQKEGNSSSMYCYHDDNNLCLHDCVCKSHLKVTVHGTTNSGPSEIGTQYNRLLYKGLNRSKSCFPKVLQKGYRST